MQEENHIFKGLKRDNHQIKQDAESLWDAHNIRLTNRDDSTLLSITNEKGPSDTGITFAGNYVGHSIVGDYLVVFTSNPEEDWYAVYRVEKTDKGYRNLLIYHKHSAWDAGWTQENPIETIGMYETELVQKVYWIDGVNPPRVINVAMPELKFANDPESLTEFYENPGHFNLYKDSFDFVQTLQLKEDVYIEELKGNGLFAPGVIQYAFTYYDKYGAESNIFYTTPLQYIAYSSRGGSPEDSVSTSFKITINNLDDFEYVRVYSIHRTSLNSEPTVKIVTDLRIPNNREEVSYIDTGTTGSVQDASYLFFVGGETIFPSTMTSKDGTLFMGGYKIFNNNVTKEIKEFFKERGHSTYREGEVYSNGDDDILFSFRTINLSNSIESRYYTYKNQLHYSNISYLRAEEHYRLGIQFQHKSGKWSEPILVKYDYTIPLNIYSNEEHTSFQEYRPYILDGSLLRLPMISYNLQNNDRLKLFETLESLGYKKVRGVICLPNTLDRKVMGQGILCPTVFNFYQRYNDGVYSQSSWFLRPSFYGPKSEFDLSDTSVDIKNTPAEFRHYHALARSNTEYAEIQSNSVGETSSDLVHTLIDLLRLKEVRHQDEFLIDQSTVTFHSPDVEFDPNFPNLDLSNIQMRIVGIIPFKSNIGDIELITSTEKYSTSGLGFLHSLKGNTENGGDTLLMGDYYSDTLLTPKSAENEEVEVGNLVKYAVYPWHRSGSINSDYKKTTGVRTAVLGTKKISNLKFSDLPVWFSKHISFNNGITIPELWRGHEGDLVKINGNTYLGDIETVLLKQDGYPIVFNSDDSGYTVDKKVPSSKDPISMKYKSTPHLVFKLNSESDSSEVILPALGYKDAPIKSDVTEVSVPQQGDKVTEDDSIRRVYWCKEEAVNKFSYDTSILNESPVGKYFTTGPYDDKNNGFGAYFYLAGDLDKAWFKGYPVKIPVNTIVKYITSEGVKYYRVRYHVSFFNCLTDITDSFVEDDNNSEEDTPTEGGEKTSIVQEDLSLGDIISGSYPPPMDKGSYLYLAELYRPTTSANSFGGESDSDIENNTIWLPAGEPVNLNKDSLSIEVPFTFGDTFFQRYDCLKTYPYTREDPNQIIEIGSFMCETRINIDGRYDRNRGLDSNLQMSPQNFNLINDIYSQVDNYFSYKILNEDYYKSNKFLNQVTWSLEKHAGSDTDPWTQVTMANTLDMDGTKGAITKLTTFNENLICFQERALSTIQFNSRVQIPVTDGVPIEISNGYKVDGYRLLSDTIGCQNKWSVCNASTGLFFIDDNTDTLYAISGDGVPNISDNLGMKWWFRENHSSVPWKPKSSLKNGIRTFYDPTYGDIYFTPGLEHIELQTSDGNISRIDRTRDAICYSEKLGQFVSQYSYGGVQAMLPFKGEFITLRDEDTDIRLWKNFDGEYNNFFNEVKGWDFSFISNENPTITKIFDTIELRADCFNPQLLGDKYSTNVQEGQPIDFIQASNEYQDTRKVNVDAHNLRKKFRIWRGQIPRNFGTRQRIRNPWTMITLGYRNPGTKLSVIHDVSVKYTL